jgi:hypothetical protein
MVARDNRQPLTVPLQFVPQESVGSNVSQISPAMLQKPVLLRFEDARQENDRGVIGRGSNDADQPFPIVTQSDLLGYVTQTLTKVTDDWGIKTGTSAATILTVRLIRFHVEESNKAVGSTYAAEVRLGFAVSNKSGSVLTEGTALGDSHRYGRARSAANCNEVLSDALKAAYANVLSDHGLQEAWEGRTTMAASPSRAPTRLPGEVPCNPNLSPEERLKRLDELLKKGLITKQEYVAQRAEIVKGL